MAGQGLTARELIRLGAEELSGAGVAEAEHDARELFLYAAGMTLAEYAAISREMPTPQTEQRYRSYLTRRAGREPLQYILGTAPFYGREFLVTPDVLIPRFDTECLVEEVLPFLQPGMRLLDLCTGSGCVLLTLLLEGPEGLGGCGSDLSPAALRIAEQNAARWQIQAAWIESDLFAAVEGRYDVITANPPYIPSADIDSLEPEVRTFEPRLALDGKEDGLAFYRRISRDAPACLKAGGLLALEIGCEEGSAVAGLLREQGFTRVRIVTDMNGLDRVIIGVRDV